MTNSQQPGEKTGTVRRIIGPTILLASGAYFDFLDPEGSDFTLDDIANGLALTCRFAGQCPRFYSVAEHSVHVSKIVQPEHAFAGLMHDAAEAFIGDVSKPLKELLPEYKAIERRVEAAIFSRFGVPAPMPPEIKEADIVMLATEQQKLMRNRDDWDYTRGRKVADVEIGCWDPETARFLFLRRFKELAQLRGAANE
jgi:hypothetical protein